MTLEHDSGSWLSDAVVTDNSARIFGGQLVGQAIAAAARTASPSQLPASIRGVFLRPGDASLPTRYRVERVRDGRAYATREVVASQGDRTLATFTTQWHAAEQWSDHDDRETPPAMPDTAQQLPYPARGVLSDALDLRWLDTPSGRGLWFRPLETLAPDPVLHACVAGYVSDLWLGDTLLRRHGLQYDDPSVRASSLDYAAWIHRPVDLDEWLYLASSAPVTAGGRGLVQGVLRTRSGSRVATIVQEVSVRTRVRPPQPESDRS